MKKAVLLIIFNRLEETKAVFEQIRVAKPPRLYILSDGARTDIHTHNGLTEAEVVQQIRDYVLDNIDWNCEVKTRFLDRNLGCGYGIYKGINWFFEHEEDGIILEDDCVPSQSFFQYAEKLLDKYKDNKRIWHISGSNFLENIKTPYDYYFSKIMHGWGWATWKDRWEKFDFDISFFDLKNLYKFSKNKNIQAYWENIYNLLKDNKIEAWDYQWLFKIVENNGICITPVKNLVTNIGINGVHFTNAYDNHRLNKKSHSLTTLNHPNEIKIDEKTMNLIYKKVFKINSKKDKLKLLFKSIRIYLLCKV